MTDKSWSKFFDPRYSIVANFGLVYILVKNNIRVWYSEYFGNVDSWYVNGGNQPVGDIDPLIVALTHDNAHGFGRKNVRKDDVLVHVFEFI